MQDTSSNFAQPCCDIQDFQAVIYSPDSGALLSLSNDSLLNYECRVQPILRNDAILTFEDTVNFKDVMSTNTNLWVHIFYVENDEKTFTRRDFRVLNVNKIATQNRSVVSLDLQDTTSYIFSKNFEGRKFKSIKEAFKYYYDKYITNDETWKEPKGQLPGGLEGFRVFLNCVLIGDDCEITIPSNKSILEGLSEELQRNGYLWFQETFAIYIAQVSKLEPSKLPKSDLIYKRYDQNLSNTPMYLYYSRFTEAPKNTQKPKTQAIEYDFENKKMNLQKEGISIDIPTEEFENTVKLEQTNTSSQNQYYQKYLSYIDTYTGRLVVPTRRALIQMFKVIRIEAHNPKASDVGDIRDSGYFIITGYTDKLMLKSKLVSLVKVSRFG